MNVSPNPSPATVRRSRRTLLLILLICLLPPVLAYVLYVSQPSWLPRGQANHGELIQPTRALPPLNLRDAEGAPLASDAFKGHWSLIVLGGSSCDAGCLQYAREVRNIRPLLRDQSQRLRVFYLAPDAAELQQVAAAMGRNRGTLALLSEGGQQGQRASDYFGRVPGSVVMLDPLSNWVLAYVPGVAPKDIYLDLKRLLRYSHIG